MTLGIAILWICIGAAAGWFGSRIMGTFARPSALANIIIGIISAVLAGFIAQRLLGADLGYGGVHADQVLVVHPEVGAQRALRRILDRLL
jgi:uncharacterized membrane protein YeaQ/YmgE (transglycosylase-associated protein family)